MLTAAELEQAVRAHFAAENERSLDAIVATVHDDVEYVVRRPVYPDDASDTDPIEGAQAVRALWAAIYELFPAYEIDVVGISAFPEEQRVLAEVRITATPGSPIAGLPAGKPMRWWSCAVLEYAPDGRMSRETVYGTLPPVLWGLERMREFLSESGAPPAGR